MSCKIIQIAPFLHKFRVSLFLHDNFFSINHIILIISCFEIRDPLFCFLSFPWECILLRLPTLQKIMQLMQPPFVARFLSKILWVILEKRIEKNHVWKRGLKKKKNHVWKVIDNCHTPSMSHLHIFISCVGYQIIPPSLVCFPIN